jgi:hypothetical protein
MIAHGPSVQGMRSATCDALVALVRQGITANSAPPSSALRSSPGSAGARGLAD